MSNNDLAKKILDLVGGQSNIKLYTHCVTRLRFNLHDDSRADIKALEALDGVLGVQIQGGQLQVILGGKVQKVYNELTKILPQTEDTTPKGSKKKSVLSRILETLSSILIPSLPPVIGGGMIKGFLYMFWEFGFIEWGSPVFNLLNIMSDGMFYFYPFLLAVSAAKRFRTNPYMAVSLAGVLMHPTILEGVNAGLANFTVLGLPIPYLDYSSSVLPIILTVWIMSYIYRFFEQRIPDIVSIIFTPMLTLLIIVPVSLICIAPLGYYIGEYLALGITAIIDFSPILAGFVIGALRPITVFTGTHHAVRAIVSQQLATYGYTTIGAMNYMSTMAQAAAPLAIYLIVRNHNKKMRDISLSATISGFLGVTEPGLYGVIMKYKVAFVAASIGGGVGAAISSYFGAAEYAMVMSSIVTIPATFGDGFMGIVIGLPVSIVVTMLIIFLFRNKVLEEDNVILSQQPSQLPSQQADDNASDRIYTLSSPATGTIKPLSAVQDMTFSQGLMGKGVAIVPADNNIVSPIDGTVTSLIDTKHALCLQSDDGVEVLIHLGIDTVQLKGSGFELAVKEGDRITKGQSLCRYDYQSIAQQGFTTDIIVVITNTDQYLDVFPNTKITQVTPENTLITIIA